MPGGTGTGKYLPHIDSEERRLHDGPSAKLFGPRSPELAPEAIQNQKPRHSRSGVGEVIGSEIVMLVETPDGI